MVYHASECNPFTHTHNTQVCVSEYVKNATLQMTLIK